MSDTFLSALFRLADLGGPVVLLLGAISILTLTVVVYKLWQLTASGVGRHHHLRAAITAWDRGAQVEARNHLAASESYLKTVVALGMETQVDAGRLEAEAEESFARLERGFRLLDTVAQLAPLLGLFGTVLGMIAAFQALQEAGAQVDPSVLAGGIWVALLTTAVGLAVAMPTSMVLNWFEARIDADRVFAGKAIQTLVAPTGVASATETSEAAASVASERTRLA